MRFFRLEKGNGLLKTLNKVSQNIKAIKLHESKAVVNLYNVEDGNGWEQFECDKQYDCSTL